MSGYVEGGVKEEVSNAFPQGGRLDQGDRWDALGGAGGAGAQHPLVPESPKVLPYRCGVVQGVGFGRAASGDAGCDGGGGVGWGGCTSLSRVGLVMGFVLAAARGEIRGGVCRREHCNQSPAACCVCGLVSGRGGGMGLVWGWHCWWWGGRA